MNIDDLISIGITDNIIMSSTIGRNKHLIPGEIISEIIDGNNDMISLLRSNDINITSSEEKQLMLVISQKLFWLTAL